MVAARHLANRGVTVEVTLAADPSSLSPVTAHQLEILGRIGVPIGEVPPPAELVIDALIGYGLAGHPRGRSAALIEWANASGAPILALDVPSGWDLARGARSPCVQATVTLTLGLVKRGLIAAAEVGDLYLADISVPPSVYRRLGLVVPPVFVDDTIVEVKVRSPCGKDRQASANGAVGLADTPLPEWKG